VSSPHADFWLRMIASSCGTFFLLRNHITVYREHWTTQAIRVSSRIPLGPHADVNTYPDTKGKTWNCCFESRLRTVPYYQWSALNYRIYSCISRKFGQIFIKSSYTGVTIFWVLKKVLSIILVFWAYLVSVKKTFNFEFRVIFGNIFFNSTYMRIDLYASINVKFDCQLTVLDEILISLKRKFVNQL
jgi:hypothetical protein